MPLIPSVPPKEAWTFAGELLKHPWLYITTLICIALLVRAHVLRKRAEEQVKQAEVAGMITLKEAMASMAGKISILDSSVKNLQVISNRGIVDQLPLRLMDAIKNGLLLNTLMQALIDLPAGMAGKHIQNHCVKMIRALPDGFDWDKLGQCGSMLDRESIAVLGDSRGRVDGLGSGQLLANLQWDYLHTGLSGKPLVIDGRGITFFSSRAWGDFASFIQIAAENNGGAIEIRVTDGDQMGFGRQTINHVKSLQAQGHGDHIEVTVS